MGKRDYFSSYSLFSGLSDRQTVTGEYCHPSLDYLYYAVQCNNGEQIERGGYI